MRNFIKKIIRWLLGEKILGAIDFFRFPHLFSRSSAFNNQNNRKLLFGNIVTKIVFKAIVETGTFRGETSAYMSQVSGLPVFTVELHPRYYGYSKARNLLNRNVHIFHSDSRAALKVLARKSSLLNQKVFFYLDAHWNTDLPLVEEIEIIFKSWDKAVIMIDDFQVPFDNGYKFDNYGPGKILCLSLLRPINHLNFKIFFPSQKSESESGHKRGCVLLTRDERLVEVLADINELVRHDF